MAKLKSLAPPADRWETVYLEPLPVGHDGPDTRESFKVLVRRPAFGESLEDEAHLSAGYYQGQQIEASRTSVDFRLKAAIVGWKELETDDGPLPFNWENVEAVCTAYPYVFRQLATLAGQAFTPQVAMPGDTLGNSTGSANDASEDSPATK